MTDANREILQLGETLGPRWSRDGWSALTPAERVFVCVWYLEADVNNGGFDQYYYNFSGDLAADTPLALEQIGAHHTAHVVARANALFGPTGPARDETERRRQLGPISEEHESELLALTSEFYEYRDDLTALLHAFVARNRADIRAP